MIKLTIVLLIGLAAVGALRKSSAALRHWVLTVSIVCAALMPMLQRIVPSWHLPAAAAYWTTEAIPLIVPIALHRKEVKPSAVSEQPAESSVGMRLDRVAGAVWATGTMAGFLLLAAGWLRLCGLASRSQRLAQGPWVDARTGLLLELDVSAVELLRSPHPALLATFGWLKPRVLLPADAGSWPAERIRIALAHELAHVSRRDWLVQLGASIFQALYWFNPIVWIACRTLRRLSEMACDDAVLRLGVQPPTYAGHLLEIARDLRIARRLDWGFPAPAMARRSSLERRVRAMLSTHRNRLPVSRRLAVSVALAIVTTAVPVAGLLASSQAGVATFSGMVMDTVGHVVPHLSLFLTNRRDQTRRETVSDASGRFEFRDLAPGDYLIGIEKPGFGRVQGRVVLAPGQDLEQDVALQVGSVQETILVTTSNADAPPPPPPAPLPQSGATLRGAPPPPPAPPSRLQAHALRQACAGVEIGGCLEPPMKLFHVQPVYPASKREAGIDGHVRLDGRIGTDGFLKELRLTGTADSDFAKASMDAVSAWRFAPTRLGGVPIETPINVTIDFAAR